MSAQEAKPESPAADPATAAAAPASTATAAPSDGSNLVGIAQRYRGEFETTFEGLRQRSVGLSGTVQQSLSDTSLQFGPQKDQLLATVQEMAAVATPTSQVLSTLTWAAVLLLGSSVGVFLGSFVLGPVIGLLVGGFGAFAAAYVALPVAAYMQLAKETDPAAYKSAEHDSALRYKLLAFSVLEGVLVGFMIQTRYVSAQPIACLIPLVGAVAYQFVAEKMGNQRTTLLGAAVGAPLAVTLLLGLISGNFTFTYFIMTLLECASIAVCLQFLFKFVSTPEQSTHVYQLALLLAFLYIKGASFLLFGGAGAAEDGAPAPAK